MQLLSLNTLVFCLIFQASLASFFFFFLHLHPFTLPLMLPASGSYFCKMQIIMPAWPTFLDYCEDPSVKVLYKCKVLLYPLLSTLGTGGFLQAPLLRLA